MASPGIPTDDDPATEVFDSSGNTETGKLKMIVDLLKRSLGVKDLAAMRLSLPAVLLEPVPNLEFWQYLDRPDLFAAINDSPDPFHRILALLRFVFSKDLKFIRGRVCKPYNSVLGEHFRCHWDVAPVEYPEGDMSCAPKQHLHLFQEEPTPVQKTNGRFGWSAFSSPRQSSSNLNVQNPVESNPAAGMSDVSINTLKILSSPPAGQEVAEASEPTERVRVAYVTEQVSHHPPISTFWAKCPERGVEACGVDQISARVSGTSIRIASGEKNKGIFVRLTSGHGEGEMYRVTHPVAQVNGILRGSFYATVSDSILVTCAGGKSDKRYRAIIEYKDESWLGRPQFLLEGVIHLVKDGDNVDDWTKVKHVPRECVVAEFEGCWKKSIRWRPCDAGVASGDWVTLLDLTVLGAFPKSVRPIKTQNPFESRRLWEKVTTHLLRKEYSEATKWKVQIEQAQRDRAAERKRKNEEFIPAYFERDLERGWSDLTPAGKKMLEEELTVKLDDSEQ